MAQTVNVTMDNVSPLITYIPVGEWSEGTPSDSYWQQYSNNTYTQTQQTGAAASLTFNGTSLWVFGAMRPNHGTYTTTLDGSPYYGDGSSSTPIFQQALFSGTQLDATQHLVTLTDTSTDSTKPYLDIDFITYQVEIPDGYVPITEDDSDTKSFQFDSNWSKDPTDVSSYSGGTGHTTSTPGASVTYSFEGALVEIYGAVGPGHGNYTVQVDGGPSVSFNGTKTSLVTQVLLFQDNSFTPGSHQVKISNGQTAGQVLTIDFAVVYGPPQSSSKSLGAATLGGIAVGACAAILVALFGVFLWWRRRHRRQAVSLPLEAPPHTAGFGTGPVIHHTPSLPLVAEPEQLQPSPTSLSADPNLLHPASTPSPPQSDSSASNDSRSRLILHNPSPSHSGPPGVQGSLLEIITASGIVPNQQQPGASGSRPLPRPGQSNTPVRTNTVVLAPMLENDLRNVRMQVEGRSQDFGPVFIPDTEHEGNLLPPDYYQATQPFPPRQQPQ